MPAPTTPCSDLECRQSQGHHFGAPQPTVPGSWYQLCDAPSTAHQSPRQSTHLHFRKLPESFQHLLKINTEWATHMTENLQCKIESNQLSRTAVRGLFVARFVRLFLLLDSSSEIGAPTSSSDPDTSVRGNPGSVAWTTGSRSDCTLKHNSLTKSSSCSSARSITSPREFIDWPAKKF